MPQQQVKLNPKFLNLDTSFEKLDPSETPFAKNYLFDINANAHLATGTGNPSGEGQNEYTLTPVRSNVRIPDAITPIGFNKCVGTFECINTRELYYFNANSKGSHGIYVISGDDYAWTKIIIDPKLNFSFNQEFYIAEHRVRVRVRYDAQKNIIEKHLLWTEGNNWQGWVNVIAAIRTDGFNVQLFPYWLTRQPHFDRRELLEYPVRPPMYAVQAKSIANTSADRGNPNWLLDTAFEFCYQFINTDGRETVTSPLSDPFIVKTEDFLSNPDLIPKKALLTLYAGSSLTEKIKIYLRYTKRQQDKVSEFQSWSIWYLYDTIYRFPDAGVNSQLVIGTDYWTRTNEWSAFNYDPIQNTLQYTFDNSLAAQIVDQSLFTNIETAMPIKSVGLTDLGDGVLLADNLYGYDNFSDDITSNLTAIVKEKDDKTCRTPFTKVKLYAYAGYISFANVWASQISYYNGDDKQFRTGGLTVDITDGKTTINVDESKLFELDFADKTAFLCYAKGTPYSAIGKMMIANADNTLSEVAKTIDASSDSDKEYLKSILSSGSYFVWQFEFIIPAGNYDFSLGRHNVATYADYRGTSTYVAGIANSKLKERVSPVCTFVRPTALVSYSKEIEVNCSNGDVDTWGNGHDLFYVTTPVISQTGFKRFRFVEGYLRESRDNNIPIELFPYTFTVPTVITGTLTDKNGHYFGYSRAEHASQTNVAFIAKINCFYPVQFIQPTSQEGLGFRPNNFVYLTDYNGNKVGFGNYVVLHVKITDLTGALAYSNIGVSIKDGATDVTDSDGNATLIIHNGQPTPRVSNIFINASGNFILTLVNCGIIPLSQYKESLVVCQTTQERVYPLPINLKVLIQANEQRSLKSNANYVVGVVGADLAGRRTFINKIAQLTVSSFPQRDDVFATLIQWSKTGALQLPSEISWFAFYVTNYINYKSYLQWVGDKVEFIDVSGNVTDTSSNAAFVRVTISSLIQANINQNFTLLANYEFQQGDKLRVYDDGEGDLRDTKTFGEVIDVDIQGSNYNQAAINANLIAPSVNTVLNNADVVEANASLYVKYDSRWDSLKNATGFWIELYTPSENNTELPYFQTGSWIPVIGGELATFLGYDTNGNPHYNFPTQGNLSYWDTYFLQRSIAINGTGNRNFNHPFESPNITDTWGVNITSAGQPNTVNPDAKQAWFSDCVIKSDNYVSEGIKNGLATFREENKKCFTGYWWGGIVAVKAINSIVFFLCENDYFTTDYNFHYTYPNQQGVMVVNLDNGLSQPHQKIDYTYGCQYEDTASIVIDDKLITWHDQKNSCYLISDFQTAIDITQVNEGDRKIGIKSYYSAKSNFIGKWNLSHGVEERFDVVAGLDMQLNYLHITFRPRRNNSALTTSFLNDQRNVALDFQETFVYSLDHKRWLPTRGYAPEAYGKLRGALGNEMFSFASGVPYYHLNTPSTSFCNFYGSDTERVMTVAVNENAELEKILQSASLDSNNTDMFIDLVYSDVKNSFSYVPLAYWKRKGRFLYAPILRNGNTYPPINDTQRSMIVDGNGIRGAYFVVRFVGSLAQTQEYQELNQLFFKYIPVLETAQK